MKLVRSICQIAKAELLTQTQLESVNEIEHMMEVQFGFCKEGIRALKRSKQDKKLKRWSELKWECLQLQEDAKERAELLKARETLYGSTELPVVPNFNQEIQKIINQHPTVEMDVVHFQHVLACCMRVESETLTIRDMKRLEPLWDLFRSGKKAVFASFDSRESRC